LIPNKKLEQALQIIRKAFSCSNLVATYTPVAATGISGVAVAIINKSISSGSIYRINLVQLLWQKKFLFIIFEILSFSCNERSTVIGINHGFQELC
jgi:hypothetical protein